MGIIQFNSRVGDDGVLSVRVPIGEAEANAEVQVTICPLTTTDGSNGHKKDWRDFVATTYGSCEGLGLEEPVDLPLQHRN